LPGNPSRRVIRYGLLGIAAIAVLFPIYVTVINSMLPGVRYFKYPPDLLPTHVTLRPYATAWRRANLSRYLVNSALVAGAITVAQVVTSVLAAYAFVFIRFPLRGIVFALFLATTMVPFEATLLPNYSTIVSLGWIDSYQALVVPFLATALGTFLLRQAFSTLPGELTSAAALDGYGHPGTLVRVVVPLCRPVIAALAVFSFLAAWSQYLWPLIVTDSTDHRTVQIGLKALVSRNLEPINVQSAGAVLAALPIFLVLALFQRHIVRGLTAGAVKG
jgi:sn-glycerol 3-phosphate transport system permease protein